MNVTLSERLRIFLSFFYSTPTLALLLCHSSLRSFGDRLTSTGYAGRVSNIDSDTVMTLSGPPKHPTKGSIGPDVTETGAADANMVPKLSQHEMYKAVCEKVHLSPPPMPLVFSFLPFSHLVSPPVISLLCLVLHSLFFVLYRSGLTASIYISCINISFLL